MTRRAALVALVAAASLAAACLDPADRRPGLRLTGEAVEGPVDDWSFSDAHGEIFIETRTPWLVPHSVTIVCATRDGDLYVGARNPQGKRWVENVARDPRVRLEIGDRLYEARLERVEDADALEAVYRAFAGKYGWEPAAAEKRPETWYYRVLPRTGG